MKKSLLKRTWQTLLYGTGRDLLALVVAGTLMLSESPLGYARVAFADEGDDTAAVETLNEVEETPAEEVAPTETVEPVVTTEPEQQAAAPETSEPASTPSQSSQAVETVDGTVILSAKIFTASKFFSLYVVDKDGQVANRSTEIPELGLEITDEYDWSFELKADENYAIDSVAYRVGNNAEQTLTAKNGVYSIPAEVITKAATEGETLTLVVKTHATAAKVAVDLSTYALYAVSADGTVASAPTATAPTRSFNIPLDKDFTFKPVVVAGYEIQSVSVGIGSSSLTELEASEAGTYTITKAQIAESAESGNPIQIVVATSQGEATTNDSNLPIPIDEDTEVAEGEDEEIVLVAQSALGANAREFSHNLGDYLDTNYDTSVYGVSGIKINGVDIDQVESISYGDEIQIKLAWGFPNTMAVKAGDQFTYQLPESIGWVFNSDAATGGVYSETGEQVGNFVINSEGLATITYTSDLGSNVVGTFTANGIITRIVNEGGPAIVTFSLAGREWKKEYISGESRVEITKAGGDYVPDVSDLTLRQFTIEVLSLGENADIVITDTPKTVKINGVISSMLEVQPDSLQVFSDEACTQRVTDGRVTMSSMAADGSFTINISEMGNFERLYVRYQSRITNEAYNAAVGRSWNHAQAELFGGYDFITSEISNTASVSETETSTTEVPSFLPSYVMRKTGAYNKETRSITWTVECMTGDNTLTLQDSPNTNLGAIDPDSIHVYESADRKTWTDASAEVAAHITAEGLMDGSAMLPSATTAGGRRYFKITFETPVNPYAVGHTYFENWIIGNGRIFTSQRGVYGGVTVDTGSRVTIEKTSVPQNSYVNYDADGNVIGTPDAIHWVSHISVPASETPYTNFVITDTSGQNSNQQLIEGTVHVYSDAQQTTEITDQFELEYVNGNERGTSYINGFTLKSDTFQGGDLYITCDANIVKVTSTSTFTNVIGIVANEFGEAKTTGYHYVNMHRLSKRWEPDQADPNNAWRGGGWSNTNSSTGRVTWSVVVSGLGNGELDSKPDVIVTDSAPDRLVIDPDSCRYVIGYIDGWHSVAGDRTKVHDIVASVDGSTVTFTITKDGDAYQALAAGKSIVILYDTNYNPDYSTNGYSQQAAGDKVTNTVTLTYGDGTSDTTSSYFTFKHQELLTKEAVYNESTAPNAIFTIHCNYWGGDLDPNSDSLTLTDKPGSALSINTNSITITTYDRAGRVVDDAVPITDMASKGFSYTRDTRTGAVTFTVPDSLHFSINYESLVTLAPGATIDDESASNSVSLFGYTTPISTSIGSEVYASRATTTSIGYGVMVEKIDADYTSLHVANATYAVQRVDVERHGSTWTATNFETIGEVTTAESGFSPAMTGLAADQVYRLIEVDSPEGYELSDDVFYLVFQGAQGDETIDYSKVTLQDDTGAVVDLEVYSSDSATKRILMSDHQTPGELVINKISEGATTAANTVFTVTGPNGYSQSFTYSQFRDGVLTVRNLIPGQYIVTEDVDSAQRTSYDLVVYAGTSDDEIGNTQTVTVEAGATGEAAAQVTFTNEYTRYETYLNVSKTWVGGTLAEDASVTVHLTANGVRLNPDVSVELSAENNWAHTFTGLPLYDEDTGEEIAYSVVEDSMPGYETSYVNGTHSTTVTNTFNPRLLPMDFGIIVEKIDADYPSQHVNGATYVVERMDVTAEGTAWALGDATAVGELVVADGFSPSLTGLEADTVYRVRETAAPEGYDVSDDVFYFAFQGDGSDLSGVTLADGEAPVDLTIYSDVDYTSAVRLVTKVAHMSDHQTPGSLTITKTSEGADTPATTRFTVTGPNYTRTFTYADFTDGSLTIEGLVPGEYTVVEDKASAQVGAYDLTVLADGTEGNEGTVTVGAGAEAKIAFTNNYERIVTSVPVTKVWNEPEDAGVTTPASVTVHLLRDGELLDPDVTLELSAATNWTGSFADLPVYDEADPSHAYAYSVVEDHIEPYDESYAGDAATGYVITNTFDETTLVNHGISLDKVDADSPLDTHVAGATYVVERVDVTKDGTTWTATGSTKVGELTTGEDGYTSAVTDLAPDTMYRLFETESPDDYELSSDVYYFVFQGTRGEIVDYSQVTLVSDGEELAYTLYDSAAATVHIQTADTQKPGSLTITKTTEGADTPATTRFTVTGPKGYSEVFTYADFTDGTLTIEGLVPGEYTVVEDEATAQVGSYGLQVVADGTASSEASATVTPNGTAEVAFTNTYTRVVTNVPVTKVWEGPIPEGQVVTVRLLRDGVVAEDVEPLELSADNAWRGTFVDLPIYDEADTSHEYAYSVEEDAVAGYAVSYAGNAADGYTITNTFDTTGLITATKYAFGEQDVYSFTLVGANADGSVRSSAGVGTIEATDGVIDFGQALTLHATTGAYNGARSLVVFPEINYRAPGDYYYLLTEDAIEGEPYDDTTYLVHVAVASDSTVAIEYTPQGLGTTSDTAEFYNNGGLVLYGMSAGFAEDIDAQQVASFQPLARKALDGRALAADEFSFLLLDDAGDVISQATNDVDGVVAFDTITYTEPGTYHYTMVEENTGQAGVDYDISEHDVVVTVTADEDGVLSAEATYDGEATEPTFTNAVQVVIVRIRKVSRDGSEDPLFNSVYGLWIEGTDGASDIYLGNDASDEDGYIYIEDVPVVEGATYYFKEESAPEGHLVDPYRIAHFRIDRAADGSFVLVSLES